MAVSFEQFAQVYEHEAAGIWWIFSRRGDKGMSENCADYKEYDWGEFLSASTKRFYKAFQAIQARPDVKTVCDMGGFLGAFPLTLKRFGYKVKMIEDMGLHNKSLHDVFDFLHKSGVTLYAGNVFENKLDGDSDFVTAMSTAEHYAHSLKTFMQNFSALGKYYYFEVPNIAYWPKRIALLRGQSPLPSIQNIFNSKEPYTGHHHEMTYDEVMFLLRDTLIENVAFFNYSVPDWPGVKEFIKNPIQLLAHKFYPNTRELIAVTGRHLK